MANVPISNLTTTWNDGATTFSGVKLNVTDTASASASLLMDLQVGGSSKFSVDKNGQIVGSNGLSTPSIAASSGAKNTGFGFRGNTPAISIASVSIVEVSAGVRVGSGSSFQWTASAGADAAADLFIARDAADTLAQRRSTNAQTFRVYNTYTDASNYERAKIAWDTNVLKIGTEKAGTGTARALELQTDGTTRLTIASTGAATFAGAVNIPGGSPATQYLSIGGSGGGLAFVSSGVRIGNGGQIYFSDGTDYERGIAGVAGTAGITITNGSTGAGSLVFRDAGNIEAGTTTGTKIGTATSQKLAFWNATPVVQPTTGITAGTFVANTSGISDDTATFDGYTIGQVVAALRQIGVLA